MKRKMIGLMIAVMLLTLALPMIHAESFNLKEKAITTPYEYSVKPGSAEWQRLSHEERHAISQIPNEIIDQMTPKALLDTVLAYPMKGPTYLYDSRQNWFDFFCGNFYGLRKLIGSTDIVDEVLGKYMEYGVLGSKKMDESNYMLLSMIIAQDSILSKLSSESLDALLKTSTGSIDFKEQNKGIYSDKLDKLIYLRALKYKDSSIYDSVVSDETIRAFIETAGVDMRTDNINIEQIQSALDSLQTTSMLALNYIYTPRNTPVAINYLSPMTSSEIEAEYQSYSSEWGAITTMTGGPTSTYNCHTYAWWSQVSPTFWIPDASAFVRDGSYLTSATKTNNFNTIPSNMSSSIVGYINSGNSMSHSAKVYDSYRHISKWGKAGLIIHAPMNSPYFCEHCFLADALCRKLEYYKLNTVIMSPAEITE